MNLERSYYNNPQFSEDERRDVAFQTVNAMRETLTLSRNSTMPVTYEYAFNVIHTLNPQLYDNIIDLLTSKNENEMVKLYKEEAEASSTPENPITPVDLIEKEMDRVQGLIDKSASPLIYQQKKMLQLTAAREHFQPRKRSEHKSLSHDFTLRRREDFFGKPLYENDDYKDFKIGRGKRLRLRLLHPDHAEAILGVDLVYENFDLANNRVRFAHMQYKSWNAKVLYLSSVQNLKGQLDKMEKHLCKSGYCKGPKGQNQRDYRFPYCSGFLRPTSKLQRPDSKLISTGLHIPICQALDLFRTDQKITDENSKERSIKGSIFEDLFISNTAGSRWIDIDELEKFYEEKNLLSHTNTIRLHAQEVELEVEADKNYTWSS